MIDGDRQGTCQTVVYGEMMTVNSSAGLTPNKLLFVSPKVTCEYVIAFATDLCTKGAHISVVSKHLGIHRLTK
jgi:hypothetical protein